MAANASLLVRTFVRTFVFVQRTSVTIICSFPSFPSFVGLRDSRQIPDISTILVFKERLIAAQASEAIFSAINQQLNQQGYIARDGQIIDASIVPVPRQTIRSAEKA
ncbi:transposase [Craterilacuibacter sinensis]|uniref:Uncharacterized protein n=1 Tax=Craterilacuibacter sinensis TaxID=2686017 RepID=A0A845BK51_9NEIS|nr:transposase [Craterilacuibacter sinensis]MXR36695.1 hypothetical protein [Craterilacuibacter sinensis]